MSNANEPAFTHGPWVLDPAHPGCIYSDDATGSIVARVGGKGFEYAPRPDTEVRANERLVAAAPAMYEALKPFAKFACDPPCECFNCKARAALAAATTTKEI